MFLNDDSYGWAFIKNDTNACYYKGDGALAEKIFLLNPDQKNYHKAVEDILTANNLFSAGLCESENHILFWTDHIRNWPLFYCVNQKNFLVSQNPRKLLSKVNKIETDKNTALEFAMSGYIAGTNTLYKNIQSLQPGEFIIYEKQKNKYKAFRYFKYSPEPMENIDNANKIKELGDVFDKLILEIIAKADGKKIWIPLSAGLDSRIILCKLHEHGYKNLESYTYGPRLNFELIHAKKIAKKLGVKWRRVYLNKSELKNFYNSDERKRLWAYCDQLKNIPCLSGVSALHKLHKEGIAKEGDIFINGQSGDYITGGHIPSICFEKERIDAQTFLSVILDKHYSLWKNLRTTENDRFIQTRIEKLLPKGWREKNDNISRAIHAETWEYDARQICYVANGQRAYEFYNFEWEMPLWDKRLVDFYKTIPISEKRNQKLYKDYLRSYNYYDQFPEKEPEIWRWPLHRLWILAFAKCIGITAGAKAKQNFYAQMKYFGHYGDQYVFYSWRTHKKTYKNARSVISLNVRDWINDHPDLFDDSVLKALKILKA